MCKRRNIVNRPSDTEFKALVVHLILNGKVEKALELLAKNYNVSVPNVKIGLPRRRRRDALGCYMAKNQTIHLFNSDVLKQPFIILHEFYHHLRTSIDKKHKGTERYAGKFAQEFIETYKSFSIHARDCKSIRTEDRANGSG